MESYNSHRERGFTLISVFLSITFLMALVGLPLLQLSGWSKRLRLQREVLAARTHARALALEAQRSLLASSPTFRPHLSETRGGNVGQTVDISILSTMLEASDPGAVPMPSWSAIAKLPVRIIAANGGPAAKGSLRAANDWKTSAWEMSSERELLTANLIGKGEVTIAVVGAGDSAPKRSAKLAAVVLGAVSIDGALRFDAEGAEAELIATGDIEADRISSSAASLLVRSVFGRVRLRTAPEGGRNCSTLLLEAMQGVQVGQVPSSNRLGCKVDRHRELWPPKEFVGERQFAPE